MVRIAALTLLLLLAGCQVGPRYCPPSLDAPPDWKGPTCEQQKEHLGPWWELFDDPLLSQLECEALTHNFNLAEAIARVEESRALAGVEGADRYPQISIAPGYSNNSQLFEFFGPRTFLPVLNLQRRVFRIHQLWFSLPLNVSYELDLWGKLKSKAQAACLSAEAQQWALQKVYLSLSSELAISYYSLRTIDSQIDLACRTIEERRRGFEIASDQFGKGLSSKSDQLRAQRELCSVEAELADLQRQRGLEENRIAQLLGKPASQFSLPHHPLPLEAPPCVPAALPATVLAQRPDIAEAERRVAAQNRRLASACAARLPSLTLTASLGSLSPTLSEFLEWISRYLSYGVTADQTVFDGGRKSWTVRAEGARFCQMEASYRDAVLTALREVEDALHTIDRQASQQESVRCEVESAIATARLDRERYQMGLSGYLGVVESESSALTAQQTDVGLRGMRYISAVQLIKSLGGRWDESTPSQ